MSAPFGRMGAKVGSYRTVLAEASVRAMLRRKARAGDEPRADAQYVIQRNPSPRAQAT